jgi:hypothetical protein
VTKTQNGLQHKQPLSETSDVVQVKAFVTVIMTQQMCREQPE